MSSVMPRIIPKIFKEEQGAGMEKGDHARMTAFMGAIAVADLVKTTLGPRGMDKILQSMSSPGGRVTFTNDGATILKSIPVDHPAAKIIVDTSKTQDEEVGDGTTSVAVLAGELLREAEKLTMRKLHPQLIMRGWRAAVKVARQALLDLSEDNSEDEKQFREDLINIARTTLSSKILSSNKDYFAELSVEAVLRLKGSTNLDSIQVIKKEGGSMRDSYLHDGFILPKRIGVGQPKKIKNARIMVANTALDNDKIKIHGARVRVESVNQVIEVERAEKKKMRQKVKKILDHDINVFISRQLIYNLPEQMFTEAGVMAIEHADFDGVEQLALVLDAEIASTFDHPSQTKLGYCDLVEEVVIGEQKMVCFSGVSKGEACTIILRGSSHLLDEAERSLHDALCILSQIASRNAKTKSIVWGGGCAEMAMARAVDDLARRTQGKEAIAIESFAVALRQLPTIIADNAGFDSQELVSQLQAHHYEAKDKCTLGLDMDSGKVGCMRKLRITESLQSKLQVVVSAHEAAEMIVRVDDIVRCAPRQRTDDNCH